MNNTFSREMVTDRESFIKFTGQLHQDLLNNKEEWENHTPGSFLEALTAYAADIQVYYNNSKQNIKADIETRKIFADMLQGVIIYE